MKYSSQQKAVYRKSPKWNKLREIVLERDGHTCQICGLIKKRGLHVHHVDELKYNEPDEFDYLVTLCQNCHRFIERRIPVLNNKKNGTGRWTPLFRELVELVTTAVR